jgi:hypothetical protein
MNSKLLSRWTPWLAVFMGVLAFWAWAGAYTLAPGHIGWVMAGMDTPSHYLGWQFFRHAPWQWLAGANPAYGSDASGSIVLSDGIPLVALALKVLSPLLPNNFQYLGMWALSCFLLQAWFARKLMSRITDDSVTQLAGAGFFLTATIFLVRVYLHPALAAQWLLLAAFYFALDERFRARPWGLLLCLAVWIHAYLFVMIAMLWLADMTRRWWCGQNSLRQIVGHGFAVTASVLILMWIAGYFMPGGPPLGSSFRSHFDLVQPFWTGIRTFGEWSWFVPAMDMDIMAYDGFCYLGLGLIVLLLVAIIALIASRFYGTRKHDGKQIHASTWIALTAACGILFFCSLGNHVYFAGKLLFSYSMPAWLDHINAIFRCAARWVWPAWYLLLLAILYVSLRRVPLRYARYILAVALLIQLCDLSKAAVDVRAAISRSPHWHSALTSPLWTGLPGTIKHVAYMKAAELPFGMITFAANYKIMADYAAQHGMTINIAYLARTDEAQLARAGKARVNLLMQGGLEPATIYVVDNDPLWAKLSCLPRAGRWLGTINGMRIIVPDTLPNLKVLPPAVCNP